MNQHCQDVTVDLRKALFGIAKALDNVGFESKNHGNESVISILQSLLLMWWIPRARLPLSIR